MTKEEKAKRYDIALDKIKRLLGTGSNCSREELEYVFPELKESESEKIRKDLIIYLRSVLSNKKYGDKFIESWIAWLENIQYTIDHAKREGFQLGYKAGIEKQGEKTEPIEDFDTEFERQISHLVASAINREYEYNKGYIKWTANALLNYAKNELEKQGEQKSIKEHNVCDFCEDRYGCVNTCPTKLIEEQKTANNVEPKFKIGDKIVEKDFDECGCGTIIDIKDGKYIFDDGGFICIEEQGLWKLVEKKPVDKVEPKFKIGDIVKHKDNPHLTYILKRFTDNGDYEFHAIGKDGHEGGTCFAVVKYQDEWELVEQNPADKVDQHSLPVSDNSSLPTFDESIYHPCTDEVYEKKSATWSEEDELHIKELERLVKQVWAIAEHKGDEDTIHKMSDLSFFLKTLKPQPKQEWSEDDEERLSDAIFFVREYQIPTRDKRLLNAAKETEDWLRTFKDKVQPQSHWKPSKEQMDMLAKVCSTLHLTSGENEIMESIYDALKKLMEK